MNIQFYGPKKYKNHLIQYVQYIGTLMVAQCCNLLLLWDKDSRDIHGYWLARMFLIFVQHVYSFVLPEQEPRILSWNQSQTFGSARLREEEKQCLLHLFSQK